AVLQDAWLDFRLSEAVQVRVGKFKSPFGLERLRSAAVLGFVERAYPTQLAPNRDLGLQVHGEVLDKRLGYALAAVDGTPDGASVDGDTSDSKDLIAQLYAVPFIHSTGTWLRELRVGGAWSWGDQDGTAAAPGLSPWRTPGQNAFYRVRPEATSKDSAGKTTTTPAVVARGVRQRVTLHGYWYGGPLSLFAEWVHTAENVQKGSDTGSLKTDAWQAAVAWVVGGNTSWNGVQPSQPFALGQPGWGAIELAARWSRLHVDGVDLERWADSKASAQRADSLTAGLHWHWSQHLRLLADLEHTTFAGGDRDPAGHVANRPRELAILTRAQLAW
ncbi:MAG: porin, partial [Deltaproteobacteria bacterium]|nr:porin [Deltaproteobacteria bacterium]